MTQPDPNAPPESLNLQAFTGIKNTVSQERLQPGELERAVNVDLDDAGQLRRRRGYTQRLSGVCHSTFSTSSKTFLVKDGTLGTVSEGWTFTPITVVGPEKLSYASVGDNTYYSSRTASGVVHQDNSWSPWGAFASDTTWLSPVVNPTDTLGAVRGKLLGPPPMATEIEYYKGRIWLAAGKTLWATELYLYNYIDKTRNFFQFEHDITMLAAVDDGLYVGTEGGVYFLSGTLTEMHRELKMTARAVPGSKQRCPASLVHPDARQGPFPESEAVLFLTDEGICTGTVGGRIYNLTHKSVALPRATTAAGLFLEDAGATRYVAAADSGGDPGANARIGDYVSAEIRRFQG